MSKNSLVLVFVALVLGACYIYFFTDWLSTPNIQILAQIRPSRAAQAVRGEGPAVYPVSFAFNQKYALTEVKVISVEEAKTNKYPHPVWHLISDSNSIPTKSLVYGVPVRGMKSKVPKARPEPLQPKVKYRLLVQAGDSKGQVDFQTHEAVKPGGAR